MATFGEFYDYCMAKPGTEETYPFGETTLVFKVGGKMYGLTSTERIPTSVNLKCDPVRALELREQFNAIIPGYHMSKKHWNTVTLDGSVPSDLICELIDHSYDLIVSSLPKKVREALDSDFGD